MSDSLRPHDCSPPGSSVHGILQARTLGWVTMPSYRASSDLGIKLLSPVHWQADSLPPEPPRKSLYWAILPLSSWALSNQEQWGVGSNFWKDWLGDPKTDWKCSRCSPYMNNECHSRYLLWIVGKHFFFFNQEETLDLFSLLFGNDKQVEITHGLISSRENNVGM